VAGRRIILSAFRARRLAFELQLLAKFAVVMCELLVEQVRDMSRRV